MVSKKTDPRPAPRARLHTDTSSKAGAAGLDRRAPVILETDGWHDYALLDSGGGRKLERYGAYRIVRPEAQAMWTPRRRDAEWTEADAHFIGIGEEESDGRWRMRKPLGETWPLTYDGIRFLGRFTSFRHVGCSPSRSPIGAGSRVSPRLPAGR